MGYTRKEEKTGQLVIVRHGQSRENLENTFAGWVNSPVTEEGIEQAKAAGELIGRSDFKPDIVYSSTLDRAFISGREMLKAMGMGTKEIIRRKELLERHYGALTGEDKAAAKKRLGEEQFKQYHRSYDIPPPPMEPSHPAYPGGSGPVERQVIGMPPSGKGSESLKDVVERVRSFWENELLPRLRRGEKIFISAHGTSLRALSMIVEDMTPEQINAYEIANATPIKYDITFPPDKGWQVAKKSVGEAMVNAARVSAVG